MSINQTIQGNGNLDSIFFYDYLVYKKKLTVRKFHSLIIIAFVYVFDIPESVNLLLSDCLSLSLKWVVLESQKMKLIGGKES